MGVLVLVLVGVVVQVEWNGVVEILLLILFRALRKMQPGVINIALQGTILVVRWVDTISGYRQQRTVHSCCVISS